MGALKSTHCAQGHPLQQGSVRQRCPICQLAYTNAFRKRKAKARKPKK